MSKEIPTSTLDEIFHFTNNEKIKVNYIAFTKGNLYHVDEYGEVTQTISKERVTKSFYCNFGSRSEEKDYLGFPIVIEELVVRKTIWLAIIIKLIHSKYQKESFWKLRIPLLTFAKLCSRNVHMKILEVR